MKITIENLDNYKNDTGRRICLGTFDGLHKGHQELLNHSDYMVTFSPHPRRVLYKNTPLELLTTKEELQYLAKNTVFIPFTESLASMSANDFLDNIIGHYLSPTQITVGYDFKFGKNKTGNIETLRTWGATHNCNIIEIPAKKHPDGSIYKSSLVKTYLKIDFNRALGYLGHPYIMSGTIVKGDNRGKSLGFPTANCDIPTYKCIPKFGVYNTDILIDENLHPSISYIGSKPTFNQNTPCIETHILDEFSYSIYGKKVMIFFKEFIRDDIKFETKDALIKQINDDIASLNQS